MSNVTTDDHDQQKNTEVSAPEMGEMGVGNTCSGEARTALARLIFDSEAAAVAHDVASYCLRGQHSSTAGKLNFPAMLPANLRENMSPKSIQNAASDAGMAIDAQMIMNNSSMRSSDQTNYGNYNNGRPEYELPMELRWPEDGGDRCGSWGGTQSSDSDHGGDGLSISVDDYL